MSATREKRKVKMPELSEHAIHLMHVVAWVLGVLDVGIVAASLLLQGGGGH